jgi:hypothetical protein
MPVEEVPKTLQFRIVYPKNVRGHKHGGWSAEIFVTFPGQEEMSLPGVTNVRTEHPANGASIVSVDFLADIVMGFE